jgi:hypothetical protein
MTCNIGVVSDQILFDKLRFIDRLTHAGVAEEQARAHAEAMEEALREAVATKSDVSAVSREVGRLDHKIDVAVRDMTIRTGGMLVALFAALAAIKYF